MTYPTSTSSTAATTPGHNRSGFRGVGSLVFIQIASGAVTPMTLRRMRYSLLAGAGFMTRPIASTSCDQRSAPATAAPFPSRSAGSTLPAAWPRLPPLGLQPAALHEPMQRRYREPVSTLSRSSDCARIAWPMPWPCCGPHCSVRRTSMSRVPWSSSRRRSRGFSP